MSKQATTFEDWKRTVKRQPPAQGTARRKPRPPEEAKALQDLVVARWELYLKAGKIEELGPRRWRYHFGRQKLVEYHAAQGGKKD